MPEYRLAPEAVADLREIGRYTTETWGRRQAQRYRASLARCFRAIVAGTARTTHPVEGRLELKCCRCEHHFIFSLHREGELPAFIAILHKNMDLPARLAERLQTEELNG